jgi:hypothetical protein
VLRLYRPREHGSVELPHWWLNGEVITQVEAGKETSLPPLHMPLQGGGLGKEEQSGARPRSDRMVAQIGDQYTNYSRNHELTVTPQSQSRASLELNLSGIGSGVASPLVATLGNVVGRDNRGNLLTQRSARQLVAGPRADGFQWRQQLSLNAPHPEATQLAWLEGDLLAQGTPYPVVAEFPASIPPTGATQTHGGVRCEVDRLTTAPLPPAAGTPASTEYLLRGRVQGLESMKLEGADGNELEPVLIGQSGKAYKPERNSDSHGSGLWEFRTHFVVPEPVVKIRLSLKVWPPLEPVGSFRLVDVPLRKQRFFLPAPPRRADTRPSTAPYFPGAVQLPALFATGGGRLVLPVRIQDRPAPGGILNIGLASLAGEQSGPLRWIEAEVVEGAARIEALKPGTYRVLRVYQVQEDPPVKGPGRWDQAELRVTVSAGKETVARPLRWAPLPIPPR